MTHLTVERSPPATLALATSTGLEAYEGVASLTLNPTTIAGGSGGTSIGTITLNAPAPTGGVVVAITSSNTELAASEATLTVPAGATTATFVVGTNANYRRYSGLAFSVTVTASHGTTSQSATLDVTAQPRPGTLSSFDVQNRGQMCFGVGVRPTGSGHQLEFGSAGNLFECVPPSSPIGQDGTCTFRQECALGCELRAPRERVELQGRLRHRGTVSRRDQPEARRRREPLDGDAAAERRRDGELVGGALVPDRPRQHDPQHQHADPGRRRRRRRLRC